MSLEQLIHFTTDIVGLERLLRLIQSTLLVIINYPDVLALVASLLASFSGAGAGTGASQPPAKGSAGPAPPAPELRDVLVGLLSHVNLVRRVMRVFRFLESFYAAYKIFESLLWSPPPAKNDPAAGRRLERWIDAVSRSFFGMYLFLEFLILPDMLLVPGLHAWGAVMARKLNTEALRFWMFGLATNAVANLLRIYKIFRDVPMPQMTEEEKQANRGSPLLDTIYSEDENGKEKDEKDHNGKAGGEAPNEKTTTEEKKLEALRLERERLKRITKLHMRKMRTRRHALHSRFSTLARKTAADVLDMTIPAVVVGWLHVEPGTVGLVMVVTTFLTGYEVWKRCGADVAARKARA